MLPAKNRLNRGQIKEIMVRGRSFFSDHLTFRYAPLGTGQLSGFAVVVAAKWAKKANERNKIKRLIKVVLRNLLPQVKAGWGGVIFLKKSVTPVTLRGLETEVKQLIYQTPLFYK
ncbi:MAG: ribonuclease P protein component [Patescibacteria group bacterium]